MHSICLVEDNSDYAIEVAEFLESHGYKVSRRDQIKGIGDWILQVEPDIIILDQFVRDGDAVSAIPGLREKFSAGIIVLTANQSPIDRIVALECGADDFVDKASGLRELIARVRAVLRRIGRGADVSDVRMPPSVAAPEHVGEWVMDQVQGVIISPAGQQIRLTNREFKMLMFLRSRMGECVTRDELSKAVMGRPYAQLDRSIDNMISRIRRTIEGVGGVRAPIVRSIRGVGYVFVGLRGEGLSDKFAVSDETSDGRSIGAKNLIFRSTP